jgi:hypothetical protein
LYFVISSDAKYVKFSIFPSTDLKKKMAIGAVALEEAEAMKLYAGLRAYFENAELPDYCEVKDLRGMQKVNAEFKVLNEARTRSEAPISAADLQQQNMKAEGRTPVQESH